LLKQQLTLKFLPANQFTFTFQLQHLQQQHLSTLDQPPLHPFMLLLQLQLLFTLHPRPLLQSTLHPRPLHQSMLHQPPLHPFMLLPQLQPPFTLHQPPLLQFTLLQRPPLQSTKLLPMLLLPTSLLQLMKSKPQERNTDLFELQDTTWVMQRPKPAKQVQLK
jgi:hypothetical protein